MKLNKDNLDIVQVEKNKMINRANHQSSGHVSGVRTRFTTPSQAKQLRHSESPYQK